MKIRIVILIAQVIENVLGAINSFLLTDIARGSASSFHNFFIIENLGQSEITYHNLCVLSWRIKKQVFWLLDCKLMNSAPTTLYLQITMRNSHFMQIVNSQQYFVYNLGCINFSIMAARNNGIKEFSASNTKISVTIPSARLTVASPKRFLFQFQTAHGVV
jgi:hypothetical protein